MDEEETKIEQRAIKIVDGYITVEIIRREKQPSDKGKVRNWLKIFKGKRKQNGRMERRTPTDYKGEAD